MAVIPAEFFEDVLPRIRDLAELRAVLYVWHLTGADRRAVPLTALLDPMVIRVVVGLDSPEPGPLRLQRILNQAVANDTLLRVVVGDVPSYLPAAQENRMLVDELAAGSVASETFPDVEREQGIAVSRPNVYALYERHIGPLTPLVGEQLRHAESAYPRAWIEDAILSAVHYNKRNWRYIDAILASWEARGGPDETYGRRA